MKRREFLASAGLGAMALTIPGCVKTHSGKKPNIVLILVDDMGWADVGCYGNTYYETPHIDRLAAEGMKFTNGYAACAVCSPTRSSVMTGRYPTRTGITDWIHHWYPIVDGKQPEGYESQPDLKLQTPKNHLFLDHEEVTIAEVLKQAGYTTCHVGKWHLGQEDWYPETQGFDYNIGGYQQGHPDNYFDPHYNNPRLEPREEGEYLTDREADEAASFINRAVDNNKPFFLYMAHYAVHTPVQAKDELTEHYRQKEKPDDRTFYLEYAAMVHSVDQALGKIMKTLEDNQVEEDTIIFFTSDNGGLKLPMGADGEMKWTDNTPLRAGKGFPYEGGIREPFIVKWPGKIGSGNSSDQMVCSIDLLPTICEMTGQPIPEKKPVDGMSLVPFLKNPGRKDNRTLYWHFPHYWNGGNLAPYSVIRDDDWKLIRWYEDDRKELYNLKDDLSEKEDLAADKPEKVKELEEKLDAWLRETGGKLPRPNPDYRVAKTVEHLAVGKAITLTHPYHGKYAAEGPESLVNGIKAGGNFRKGWQGFEENDLIATIDLGKAEHIKEISIGFLQAERQWIFMPRGVRVDASADGKNFNLVATIKNDVAYDDEGLIIKEFTRRFDNLQTRYIRVRAKNMGTCPQDHSGAGGKAWLFADEIIVR